MKRIILFLVMIVALLLAEQCDEATIGRFVFVWVAIIAIAVELLT